MGRTTVEIPKSHRNEWKSKRNFQALLEECEMYMPSEWTIRDYGIDGYVEIARQIQDSESFRPESQFFLVQLKSSEEVKVVGKNISISIPVKKIFQWYRSNLPVMFVLNDFAKDIFYSIWIDDSLITSFDASNENWVNQGKITLKIPVNNIFSSETASSVRDYVLHWKRPTRKLIQPGVYFDLKENCKKLLQSYSDIAKSFGFESVNNSLNSLDEQIEKAIYRIAITGLSRVGKSTLVNALLKRKDVTPTGFWQTTGVPIQILPDKKEHIKIYFRDGKSITKKFSFNTIREYASQDENEDNKKEVSVVAIHLVNQQLERGVSLFDIPGLNDPNDEIYNYAWSTATKANAILYVIDASSAEHGGFIFSSEYKSHILKLGQSLDKIFLVFNKVNALSGNKLQLLKDKIIKDLKKLNLYDKVSEKIYYISAEESLNARIKKIKGEDTVQKLEDDIWSYLLKEGKIGLMTLASVNKEVLQSTVGFEGILRARLLDNDKRKQLIVAINKVKEKVPDLGRLYRRREIEIRQGVARSLENRKNAILLNLENYLKSIPVATSLPDKKAIRDYLIQGAHKTLDDTSNDYSHQVNLLKELIDSWIESNLKQVREIIKGRSEKKIINFSEVESFEPPALDLSPSFGMGILMMIGGFIINPIYATAAFFFGFFGNWFFSAESLRAKAIARTMEESRKRYNEMFERIQNIYVDLIKEHSVLILKYANDKINLFINDLKSQTDKLNKPISVVEESQYQQAFKGIELIRKKINKADEEIHSWYSSI